MAINTYITDPTTERQASVVDGTDEPQALVVATRDLKTYENNPQFFLNTSYGSNMNQNAEYTGVPSGIHNGTDSALWTASSIAGVKFTFNSTDVAHSGTKSIKIDSAAVGNTMQLSAGSSQNISTYTKLSMWAYVSNNWGVGDQISIYGWNGGVVGNAVYLGDYFNWSNFSIWHKLTIPLADMGLQTAPINALRMTIVAKDVLSPLFYLDDIQLRGSSTQGSPIEYFITPPKSKWFYVHTIKMLFVDNYDSTLANSSMQKIPYNSLLGLSTLPVGLIYRRYSDTNVVQSFVLKNVADILALPDATLVDTGGDGTNTWLSITIKFTHPVLLKSEDSDKISFTINDDMSSLLVFKCSAGCREEDRNV